MKKNLQAEVKLINIGSGGKKLSSEPAVVAAGAPPNPKVGAAVDAAVVPKPKAGAGAAPNPPVEVAAGAPKLVFAPPKPKAGFWAVFAPKLKLILRQ